MQGNGVVAIFDGGEALYMLRPANNGKDQYFLPGECFVKHLGILHDFLNIFMEEDGERIIELM